MKIISNHYHANSLGGKVENCDIKNIGHISQYHGRGINNYGQHVDVLDCTFTDIQRIGVFTYNPTATTLIDDCSYTGKGAGDWLDYDVRVVPEPKDSNSNYWLNAIFLKNKEERDQFLAETNGQKIMTRGNKTKG